MAGVEFHFDPRVRRYHVPLITQQHRLRHLRSIAARNVIQPEQSQEIALFYTLHTEPASEAFYSSEIMKDNLNPVWKDFEPSSFPEPVNPASSYITVKLWNVTAEIKLLVEWVVFFAGLHFIGKQVPKEGKHFKPNTLIFGMLEGFYGCADCKQCTALEAEELFFKESLSADASALSMSYALNTVGRIKTIERAIKQTQATAVRRQRSIEKKLKDAKKIHNLLAEKELYEIKVSMLQVEVKRQKDSFFSLQCDFSTSQENLMKQKSDFERYCNELGTLKQRLMDMWRSFWESRENLLKTEAQLTFRRKELISDLIFIYPIVEFPDQKGYSIHSVHLPNSENLAGHDETMMSVAFGYVCHLILMISQFHHVPLRYEMRFGGSRSSIIDHISVSIPVKNREFPLYCKGKDRRFFEYGVYLLNKNIAQLRILFGLTTKELSATLPNLYSLIQHRLSVTSESYTFVPRPATSQGCSEEKSKTVSEKHAQQNGLTHSRNSTNEIQAEVTKTKVLNSEIEHLKKEMAAMMPSSVTFSENICTLPSKTHDMFYALSGSLDKGLDDIKVIEKSCDIKSHKPEKIAMQMRRIGHGCHHSSSPNLSSGLQVVDTANLLQSSGSLQFQNPPVKMWVVGGSHTNSEEEQAEDSKCNSPSERNSENLLIRSHQWNTQELNNMYLMKNGSNFAEIEKAMLEENDLGEDLAIRTEQLANRSSSFQMQKMNMSNADS